MNNENFNVGTATATNLTRNHTSSPKLQGPIGVVVASTIAALRPLVDCMFI